MDQRERGKHRDRLRAAYAGPQARAGWNDTVKFPVFMRLLMSQDIFYSVLRQL